MNLFQPQPEVSEVSASTLTVTKLPLSVAYQIDCLPALRQFADKQFDLAVVDPPYGINAPNMSMGSHPNRKGDGYPGISVAQKLKKGRLNQGSGKLKNRAIQTMPIDWDFEKPSDEYFHELFRVSVNQIIWGGNYFDLPPTRGIIVWDKMQPWDNFSQVELAWSSFDVPARIFHYSNRGGNNKEKKIHPTQKPVPLYDWLLHHYAKLGDTILDTHLGSGSSRIAAYKAGLDFTGFEINENYYQAQEKRFQNFKSQLTIF